MDAMTGGIPTVRNNAYLARSGSVYERWRGCAVRAIEADVEHCGAVMGNRISGSPQLWISQVLAALRRALGFSTHPAAGIQLQLIDFLPVCRSRSSARRNRDQRAAEAASFLTGCCSRTLLAREDEPLALTGKRDCGLGSFV